SCSHMGVGHLKVYSFSKNLTAVEIYSTNKNFESNFYEWISFEALYVDDDKFYILASGILNDGMDHKKSYLLKFSKGELVEKIEFDCLFTWVKNIIVYDDMLLIGMDKIVAVVDIGTKRIKAYTHISKEAEENIKMVEEQKLTRWELI
ncbi:MAG: hypothetical protein K2K01_07955, partial [Eubacterium sp.]|nr:hypothetical protein [Eubacterium sp.]